MDKIAILSNRENSAISHVLTPVARALDIDIHYHPYPHLGDITKYDVVHVGYVGLASDELLENVGTVSLNVWNISVEKIPTWLATHGIKDWDHFVVDDVVTYQTLGQLGSEALTLIPLAFDASGFDVLPVPDEEFTVGIFCNNYPSKRSKVVFDACKLAGVRCFFQALDPNRTHYSIDPVRDVYRHIHVLAHASFTDTNSMPVWEAQLCGRPVITTHNFGVHRVITDGVNGYFYGGGAAELAEKIIKVRNRYDEMRELTIKWRRKPPLQEAIAKYKKLFKRLAAGDV